MLAISLQWRSLKLPGQLPAVTAPPQAPDPTSGRQDPSPPPGHTRAHRVRPLGPVPGQADRQGEVPELRPRADHRLDDRNRLRLDGQRPLLDQLQRGNRGPLRAWGHDLLRAGGQLLGICRWGECVSAKRACQYITPSSFLPQGWWITCKACHLNGHCNGIRYLNGHPNCPSLFTAALCHPSEGITPLMTSKAHGAWVQQSQANWYFHVDVSRSFA